MKGSNNRILLKIRTPLIPLKHIYKHRSTILDINELKMRLSKVGAAEDAPVCISLYTSLTILSALQAGLDRQTQPPPTPPGPPLILPPIFINNIITYLQKEKGSLKTVQLSSHFQNSSVCACVRACVCSCLRASLCVCFHHSSLPRFTTRINFPSFLSPVPLISSFSNP